MPAGLALSSDGKTLWAANVDGHSVAPHRTSDRSGPGRDLRSRRIPIPTAWRSTNRENRLYVSLWNRAAVAVVDTKEIKLAGTIATQEHPNELLLAKGGKILYVANANRNTVRVIDTAAGKAVETIGTAIDPKAPAGCTPSSLALSPDESMLLVANANTNNLAVVNVKEPGASTPLGFIPTGWYPTSVRVSRDGKTIYVTNGKGPELAGPIATGPTRPFRAAQAATREYIGGLFQGTLSIIPMPSPGQMARYSRTVYECSPLRRGDPTAVTRHQACRRPSHPRPRGRRRRRSSTSSTSSRRTAPTTRSSATCPKAMATRISASSPRR